MNKKNMANDFLKSISTNDLWIELGRRHNIQYGKIQKVFHGGKPSEYTEIDLKIKCPIVDHSSKEPA